MDSQGLTFMRNCYEVITLLTDAILADPSSEGLTLLNETIEALQKAAEKLARLMIFTKQGTRDENFERNICDDSPRPPNWNNPAFFRNHVNNVFQNSGPPAQHSQQDLLNLFVKNEYLLRQNTNGSGSGDSSTFIRNKTYEVVLNSNQPFQQNDKDNLPISSSAANDSVAINSKELSSSLVKDNSCELKFETKPSSSQNVSYQNDELANKDESLTPNLNTSSNPCVQPAQDVQPNKESSLSNPVNDESNTNKNTGQTYHQNQESVDSFQKFQIYFSINHNKVTYEKVAAALGAIGVKNGYKIHGLRSRDNGFFGFISVYKHETYVKILEERYSIKVGNRHMKIEPAKRRSYYLKLY